MLQAETKDCSASPIQSSTKVIERFESLKGTKGAINLS